MNKVSNCCGALPIGETYDDLGFCSDCRDHAVFESEEDNDSIQPTTRVETIYRTQSIRVDYIFNTCMPNDRLIP